MRCVEFNTVVKGPGVKAQGPSSCKTSSTNLGLYFLYHDSTVARVEWALLVCLLP